eukprot:Sspe_Gene.84081::Locus_55187_Transcript_1_1_Confidence_1.000_Length_1854::g.84081::m.84081
MDGSECDSDDDLPSRDTEEIIKRQQAEIDRLKLVISGRSDGTLEQKFLDALRKAKTANVKLESEKAKSEKLVRQLADLQKRLQEAERLNEVALPQSARGGGSSQGDDDAGTSPQASKREKELKVNLERVSKTNADLKRQQVAMKQEVQRYKDLLKKELGDTVDIEKLLKEEGEGWRGRAQQISLLKAKVKELQRQLAAGEEVSSVAGSAVPSSAPRGGYDTRSVGATTSATRDHDELHKRNLDETVASRKLAEAKAQQKLEDAEKAQKTLKEKLTASSARIQTLEKEVGMLKMQLGRVIEKTENDDKLLEAYKKELAAKRVELKSCLQRQQQQQQGQDGGSTPSPKNQGQIDHPSDFYLQQAEAHEQHLREKDRQIEDLQQSLASLKARLAERIGDELQSASTGRDLTRAGSDVSSKVLSVELQRLRELVEVLRDQQRDTMARYEMADQSLRDQRIKMADMERRLGAAGSPPMGAPAVDASALPPQVVDKINMLKEENASLKDRVQILQSTMNAEVAIWRDVADEQKRIVEQWKSGGGGRDENTPRSSSGTPDNQQQQELEELRRQYQELKRAYNTEMQRRMAK